MPPWRGYGWTTPTVDNHGGAAFCFGKRLARHRTGSVDDNRKIKRQPLPP
jgi:hypothetical protein